jgi:hypothetical protein|nr:MAG TPA: hypothetical protein [Caudoviricetes sp.]
MKEFIQNHQFNYVNDSLKVSGIDNVDHFAIQFTGKEIQRVGDTATSSSDFLLESMDRIEQDLEKWHNGYIEKIGIIKSGSDFIQGSNLSSEDAGHYSIMKIDTNANGSMVYSVLDEAYIMPPYDERYFV